MKLQDSLLLNNSIKLGATAETWQEAIKIGTDMLVAADVITPNYYHAIIAAKERFGPFFVLAPGLAMPHARPEEGVKKTGFALVVLDKAVPFGDEYNDPIDILITLAAIDNNSHQEAIVQVVNIFEQEENFTRLRNSKTINEIMQIILAN